MLVTTRVGTGKEGADPLLGREDLGAADTVLAPLADLDEEVEVAHKLVIDDVVVASVRPEEVCPEAIDPVPEVLNGSNFGDRLPCVTCSTAGSSTGPTGHGGLRRSGLVPPRFSRLLSLDG
jgi:hypothetical protein